MVFAMAKPGFELLPGRHKQLALSWAQGYDLYSPQWVASS